MAGRVLDLGTTLLNLRLGMGLHEANPYEVGIWDQMGSVGFVLLELVVIAFALGVERFLNPRWARMTYWQAVAVNLILFAAACVSLYYPIQNYVLLWVRLLGLL